MKLKRKHLRNLAKKTKQPFSPNYNGTSVKTFEEYYGVGYERFNNKYVTIKQID